MPGIPTPPSGPQRSTRGLQAAVLIGGLAVILLLWAGVSYHLRFRQDTVREGAHRDVRNLSIALEQQVERLLVSVDQTMRFMQDDLARDPERFDVGRWMTRSTALEGVASQIAMFDTTGALVASRTPLPPGAAPINVRDRAYFRALSGAADPGLYVDRTFRGRITGRYALQLARRLAGPDGGFAGVLVVSVDPDYIGKQFEAIDVGRGGSVALFGRDGYIRARVPMSPGMYEVDATAVATGKGVFAHLAEAPSGTYELESAFDHTPRIFGYRAVGTLPLVVTVGKSLEWVMAPFEVERRRALWAGAALTLALVVVLAALVVELEQRGRRATALADAHRALARTEASLREANRLHAMAERVAQVGHWYVRIGDPVYRWSDEMYRIHDVDRARFVPCAESLAPLFHPDDRERIAAWWRSAFEEHAEGDAEHRMLLPTGRVVTVLVRNVVERDAAGTPVAILGAVMDVTERRRAQDEIQRTSALLAGTLDCMDQGLIMVGADRTVQVVNRRAAELLELPAGMAAARPSYRTFRAQARRAGRWGRLADETPLALFKDEGGARHVRAERRNAVGQTLEIRTIRTADGGMVQTYTDISDQRGAENRYRLLAENASDLIALKPTLAGPRSYVSPASRAVVGWEPDELAVLPTDQFVHPDDLAQLGREFASLTAGTPRCTSVHRCRHKAGHYVWVEAVFQLTNAGRPDEAVIVSARDITARRSAEAALRESEARHRLLAETTSDMIARIDLDGTLRYVSPAVEAVIGYAADEVVGRRTQAFMHPDDRDRVAGKFRDLVGAGRGARSKFEYRFIHKDGSVVWVEVNPAVLFDEASGAPTGYIDVARDISARKATEALLQAAREQTEAARLQAEQASQAKTDFLASMSHEIRTPLNGILGYTDLILDDDALTAEQRRKAERIRFSGGALLTVVDDILDFSKIEAGEADLDPIPFRLAELLDNTVSIVRGSADRKRLPIRVEADPALPARLVGDPDRLRRILLNFLNNAVKFTARGQITLSVTALAAGEDPCRLRFAVSDTGIGIPADKRARLFQRFSQIDGSIRREFGGTGLGLAISKGLVDLMGGAIGVESREARGSTFWFAVDLPWAGEGVEAQAPAETVARAAAILLVEDLAINREIACAVLGAAGHSVDVAEDGLQAVAAVQAKPYDLVLMDVQMPGMDGITATRHIRALTQPARLVPIIAMTANVLPQQVAEFRAAGMDDHIGKPFQRAELYAVVERWVGGVGVPAEPPGPAPACAVDRSVYESVAGVVGVSHMDALLDQLACEIDERLSDPRLAAADRGQLSHGAHSLVSAAGLLGFLGLSEACRRLEAACREGAELRGLLDEVRDARQRTLSEIELLRAAA